MMRLPIVLLLTTFAVRWSATSVETVPCKDGVTRDKYSNAVTEIRLDACKKKSVSRMKREFSTTTEATDFIKGCPEGTCSRWSLKEVTTPDEKKTEK